MMKIKKTMIQDDIKKRIPHRDPFLLVDSVDIMEDEIHCVGHKTFTGNEFWSKGHFPGNPIMPGVLILEAMAQTASAAIFEVLNSPLEKNMGFFATIEKVRFRKPVLPGNKIVMNIVKLSHKLNLWKFSGSAFVGDDLVAEAVFSAMMI